MQKRNNAHNKFLWKHGNLGEFASKSSSIKSFDDFNSHGNVVESSWKLAESSFITARNIILAFFILVSAFCEAQNIVPNYSFEDTVSTPLGGTIDDATGWINCYLSPDYYNPAFDSDGFGFGVPNCFYTGYQNAYDGNSFAGFGLTQVPEQPGEFFGIQLSQPLTIGTKYYVSTYLSQANFYPCSTNNFGFRFFNSLYFLPSFAPPPIDNFAHVTSSIRVTDTIGWQLVGGTFIADSAYQYLVMGNFYNLLQTDTLNCFANPDVSYYYVDNVCVSSDSASCLTPTSLGKTLLYPSEVSVFPNPTSNILHIRNVARKESYILYNCIGEEKERGILFLGNNTINVSAHAEGLYFLTIQNSTYKIIIRNH